MRRTPEQEAARKKRQWETSQHTKCACGNVAKLGTKQCSRCADQGTAASRRKDLIDSLVNTAAGLCGDEAHLSLDDYRQFVEEQLA